MSTWVKVGVSEKSVPVEIETEDDGTINLEDVTAHFPGATTLKYKSKEGTYRSVKCSGGVLKPPGGSWDAAELYEVVVPGKPSEKSSPQPSVEPSSAAAMLSIPGLGAALAQELGRKRTFEESEFLSGLSHSQMASGTEAKRVMTSQPDLTKPRDLIILGLSPSTSSQKIKDYFETYGDVAMVQTKKSKDSNVSYAFIRFQDKSTERKVLSGSHELEDRKLEVRIPDSQQQDKELRKVYVCYHEPSLTEEQLKTHFEQYGSVVEVFIPKPWKHYCFVTFHDAEVAQSLVGCEHFLDGKSLMIKSQRNPKKKPGSGGDRDMEWPHGPQGGNGPHGGVRPDFGGHMSSNPPLPSVYDRQQIPPDYSNFWGPPSSGGYNYGGSGIPGTGPPPSARGPPTGIPPPGRPVPAPVPPPSAYQQFEAWKNKTGGAGLMDSWRRY